MLMMDTMVPPMERKAAMAPNKSRERNLRLFPAIRFWTMAVLPISVTRRTSSRPRTTKISARIRATTM